MLSFWLIFSSFSYLFFFAALLISASSRDKFKEADKCRREAQKLHETLDDHREKNLQIIASKEKELLRQDAFLKQTYEELSKSHIQGRKWLVSLISEAKGKQDEKLAEYLENKVRPAYSAAEVVRKVKEEKQKLRQELFFLRSKIETYEEYFPFLKELEEDILNDSEDFRQLSETDLKEIDPVRKLLSYEEYSKLSVDQRNQLALDRYLSTTSKVEIGKMYERFLGWEFEKSGYHVQYDGLLLGLVDRGRDFILSKDGSKTIKVVQAKCWSQSKIIHEKHIFQLFGTTYELQKKDPLHVYQAVFVTTTALSDYAEYVAKLLKIQVVHKELKKDWPMIKCNIGSSGNKIYHLPFDQQYDKTRIDKPGEHWVKTVKEAERLGFRRAYRWKH